jgi:hypothetical protein
MPKPTRTTAAPRLGHRCAVGFRLNLSSPPTAASSWRPVFRERAMPDDCCRAAVAVLPGFRQRLTPGIGLGKLYDRLEQGPCRDRTQTWLGLRTWNGDHEATAAWIDARDPDMTLAVAYSYGAGWALGKLADALRKYRRRIDHVYLIDPVPRYRMLASMRPRLGGRGDS